MPKTTTPEVLTVTEVAAFMRVSRETVYRLTARGELPGRKIGRIWRFPKDAIQEYMRGELPVERTSHAAQGRGQCVVDGDDVTLAAEQPRPSEEVEGTTDPKRHRTVVRTGAD